MIRQHGFTLLELLISLAIFALIGAMAYGGLQQVLNQREATEEQSQRLADLQTAYRIMQRDLEQLIDRGIRNQFGDSIDGLISASGYSGIEFSRAGRANPAGFLRSELQRVAYVPDQDRLLRRTWRVMDRAQDSLPDEEVLVEDMRRFGVRFLDDNNEWQDNWPPNPIQADSVEQGLPRAAEVELELEDLGTLNWVFVLPQNFVPTPQTAAEAAQELAEDGEAPAAQDDGEDEGDAP